MKNLRYKYLMLLFAALTILYSCSKKDATTEPGTSIYFPKVKSIIQNNCLSCHNSSGPWTGRPTKFDNDSDIVHAYTSIKAAVADPVTMTNKRMPEGSTLSSADIDIIVKWYNKGGKITD